MRKLTLILLLAMLQAIVVAQNTEIKKVTLVINTMFDAMREGDSTKLKSCFHRDLRMHTAFYNKEGESTIEKGSVQQFLKGVGTPHEEIWDERISNLSIVIDRNLAVVHCDYKFYVEDEFSHCGIDAFHLVKQNSVWKILDLADTRRKEGCD